MPKLSDNAKKVFETLYSFTDESIKDTFERVADEFGTNKKEKELAYELQENGIWRPNTPVYLNAGTKHKIFSACYVVSLKDSMDSIYDVANVSRKIFGHGSGVGIPIGNLRGKEESIFEGEPDKAPEGKSSGPIIFMKLYDAVGETTKSGGRVRRAAILCSMHCWHPDIMDFISSKEIDGTYSNMNISVSFTDKFMEHLNDNVPFPLVTPYDGTQVGTINPKDLWDKLVEMSHKTGDPGVIFIDTVNKYNILKKRFLIETSNPCVTGDTLVLTIDGMKRIDELTTEDKIFTYDIENDKIEIEVVDFVGKTRENTDIIEIEIEDGNTLKLTPDHKVYTENRGYVKASDLDENDILLLFEKKIVKKRIKSVSICSNEDVYDLSVGKNHNFFANNILVHNCGEQFLQPFNCCNLSAINVSKFVKDGEIDYKSLYEVSYDVAKLMDNVIDTMHYPDPRFEMNSKRYRPIGIGFMGLSDLFYMLDIKYDSAIGKRTAGKIMRTITSGAVNASADMAKEKGKFHDYDVFKEDVENIVFQHIKGHWDEDLLKKKIQDNGLRNCAFTSVQPTGTTALSCDASYGMEPCFGLVFKKNLVDGTSMNIANPVFRDRFKDEDWYNESLIEKISQNNGSLKGIHGVPKKVRDIFVTAHDIRWKDRIDIQSSIQQHCSNAISSTINLSEDTPKDEIDKIYRYAYERDLKGITIYRDGSKQSQPVVFGKKQREVTLEDFDRPSKLLARVHKLDTGNGKMYVTVSSYDGKPIEVFLHVGKSGQVVNTFSEALGRVISIALQNNVSIDSIVKTLIGINSDKPTWTRFDESETKMKQVLSVPDGLAQLLKRFYSNSNRNELDASGELCPKCGTSFLLNIEGCSTCSDCGYSACA